MTSLNQDGLSIGFQDLSNSSPSSEDNGRIFHHDGSSTISLSDGTTTSQSGYYWWDETTSAWTPLSATLASVNGNRVYAQSSSPVSPTEGDIWIDTS